MFMLAEGISENFARRTPFINKFIKLDRYHRLTFETPVMISSYRMKYVTVDAL